MYGSTPWDDTDFDQLKTIPHTNPHRLIDPLMSAADKVRLIYSTNVTTQRCTHMVLLHAYRIRTPTIYDFATGQLVDLGI